MKIGTLQPFNRKTSKQIHSNLIKSKMLNCGNLKSKLREILLQIGIQRCALEKRGGGRSIEKFNTRHLRSPTVLTTIIFSLNLYFRNVPNCSFNTWPPRRSPCKPPCRPPCRPVLLYTLDRVVDSVYLGCVQDSVLNCGGGRGIMCSRR